MRIAVPWRSDAPYPALAFRLGAFSRNTPFPNLLSIRPTIEYWSFTEAPRSPILSSDLPNVVLANSLLISKWRDKAVNN